MNINPVMNLSELKDYMSSHVVVSDKEAAKMRDLINREAINYGWNDVDDIEDQEWFAMLEEACKEQ